MKYKNYRNSYTNDNRIYSFNDIYNMPIGEVLKRKQELLSQYRVLGIPKEKELQASDNVVYVHSYTRDDGVEVKAHYRSKPDGIEKNNIESNEIVKKGNDNLDKEKANINENDKNKQYIKPVEGRITSDFGYRTAPVAGATTNHSGIDIGVPIGTPVKAIADGTVTAANGGMRGYGNGVFIDHGMINGKHVVSEYGHLSSFDVKVGDKIKKGQQIAKSGNTGTSSGPHLHITIRENKIPVDPKKYLGNFSN